LNSKKISTNENNVSFSKPLKMPIPPKIAFPNTMLGDAIFGGRAVA
jgi:hypothetical protein